jgi:hypothetical protein
MQIVVLPESGATVLVGVACGFVLRFMFGTAVRESAEFSPSAFMLVLLVRIRL